MSDGQNVEIVRHACAAFGRGDLPGLLNLMDPEVSWVTPGPPDLPTAGPRRGHDDVRRFFEALPRLVEITRFEPREFFAQGDKVVVLGHDSSIFRATGKSLEFRWVHVFTVRDAKIVAFEEIGDTSAMVAELRSAQARV